MQTIRWILILGVMVAMLALLTACSGDDYFTDGDESSPDGDTSTPDGDEDNADGDADTDVPDGDADPIDHDYEITDGDTDATDGDADATDGDADATDGDADTTDGDADVADGDNEPDAEIEAEIETEEELEAEAEVETEVEDEAELEAEAETPIIYSIASVTQTFTDSQYGQDGLPVQIHYPTTDAGRTPALVAEGAFPVIVFGHGYQESPEDYLYIRDALVPLGYILVFPEKLSSSATIDVDAYTADLRFLLNKMQTLGTDTNSAFYQHVLPTSALMGHSTGAGTDFNTLADMLSTRRSIENIPLTVVSLAPLGNLDDAVPISGVWPITAAATAERPSLIIDGGEDCITPPAMHSEAIYDALPVSVRKYRVTISEGDHCGFGDPSGPGMTNCEAGEYTYHHCYGGMPPVNSQGATIGAAAQNPLVTNLVVPWIEHYLKNVPDAWTDFESALSANGLAYEHSDPE